MALSAALAASGAAVAQAPPPQPSSALGLTADEMTWLAEHPVIRLGPNANHAPVQFVDQGGTHHGIAAEYVALIEQMLDVRFQNVPTQTWQEILDKARAREIDVIALAAETEDRRAYLRVTRPYLDLPAVIIARVGVEERLTLEDLAGMRVAVVRGYAVHDWLMAHHPGLELDPVPDTRTALRKVSFGIDDAIVSDLAVAAHVIDAEGIGNLRVVGDSGFTYHLGFATRSDWPELTAILEKALAQIPPQTRQEIHDRWISLSRETEFASRRAHWVLLAALAAVATLAAAALLWNRTLRRRVDQRTAELGSELTERRRAVEALRSSEERIRAIIGTALDAIITMDGEGNVSGWSEQAERTFGWSRDEAIGKPLAELIVPLQYREAHRRGLERFRETGEGPALNRRFEITALTRDGREIPVELSIAPIRRNGTCEFSAFVRDITERKQAEVELERHRNRLEELVVQRTAALCEARDVAESARADLSERVRELEAAMSEVRRLRGLLPVCSYCHRIREGEAYTKSVEAYLAEHSTARFSHGVCPDCYEQYVRPQLEGM